MTKFSSISLNATLSAVILIGGLFVYQAAVAKAPGSDLIYAPSGELRQLPMEFLRLRPTMW